MSEARVESLTARFQRLWLRSPTQSELEGLIEDHLREEVLYREALALGLDRDDLIVRRRLRQKLEFLNEDLVAAASPNEADLAAYLASNPERYRLPSRTSFQQVFVDPQRSGDERLGRAAALLRRLEAGALRVSEAPTWGDPTLLPAELESASPREIDAIFGPGFAEELAALEPNFWAGPVESAYGLHLVRVTARVAGRLPELAEARDAVERDWRAERRRAGDERFYQRLRARYQVEVRLPPATSRDPLAAVGVQ